MGHKVNLNYIFVNCKQICADFLIISAPWFRKSFFKDNHWKFHNIQLLGSSPLRESSHPLNPLYSFKNAKCNFAWSWESFYRKALKYKQCTSAILILSPPGGKHVAFHTICKIKCPSSNHGTCICIKFVWIWSYGLETIFLMSLWYVHYNIIITFWKVAWHV